MRSLSLVLPGLNPPGYAFTGRANAAARVRFDATFLPISLEFSPRGALGSSQVSFSAPGVLQERFWRALGAEVARRRRPRRSRRPPGSIFGDMLAPKTVLFGAFFRASVAWCFSLAFGQFFVRLSFCLKDVRAPRANGAHADYIVKTNGFKHIFKLCFRAGECRGEQNTHGSGKKTHAKTAPKKQTFW